MKLLHAATASCIPIGAASSARTRHQDSAQGLTSPTLHIKVREQLLGNVMPFGHWKTQRAWTVAAALSLTSAASISAPRSISPSTSITASLSQPYVNFNVTFSTGDCESSQGRFEVIFDAVDRDGSPYSSTYRGDWRQNRNSFQISDQFNVGPAAELRGSRVSITQADCL